MRGVESEPRGVLSRVRGRKKRSREAQGKEDVARKEGEEEDRGHADEEGSGWRRRRRRTETGERGGKRGEAAGRFIVRLRGSKRRKNWRALSPTESSGRGRAERERRREGLSGRERDEESLLLSVEPRIPILRPLHSYREKSKGSGRWEGEGARLIWFLNANKSTSRGKSAADRRYSATAAAPARLKKGWSVIVNLPDIFFNHRRPPRRDSRSLFFYFPLVSSFLSIRENPVDFSHGIIVRITIRDEHKCCVWFENNEGEAILN